jgi:hypothetical protein
MSRDSWKKRQEMEEVYRARSGAQKLFGKTILQVETLALKKR